MELKHGMIRGNNPKIAHRFRIPYDPLDLIQPDWTTQLSHALECYNITAEEEDEDLCKINIHEIEGRHEVEGL